MRKSKSNFIKAITRVLNLEGDYGNNPIDKGGETFKGIARNMHPEWEGWQIIDAKREDKNFPENLFAIAELKNLVSVFYHQEYWDKLGLEDYPYNISARILDVAINCGVKKAIRLLQNTANILNRNQKLYANIKVDGFLGKFTRKAFALCLKKNSEKMVYTVLTLFQGEHYLRLMILHEPYEQFVGWFNRLDIKEIDENDT